MGNFLFTTACRYACLVLVAIFFQTAVPATGFPADEINDFPATIELKTPEQNFTHKFFFLLRNGRIWVKSRTETGEGNAFFELQAKGPDADGPTGEIKAAFKKRLRFEFNQ